MKHLRLSLYHLNHHTNTTNSHSLGLELSIVLILQEESYEH